MEITLFAIVITSKDIGPWIVVVMLFQYNTIRIMLVIRIVSVIFAIKLDISHVIVWNIRLCLRR